MFNTRNMVDDIKDVPVPWVFEHYCSLTEHLTGQDIKIHSVFNELDKTPSMSIYFDKKTNKYRFKDFSTGRYGDCIDLVQQLEKLDYWKASIHIMGAYRNYILSNEGGYQPLEYRFHDKFKVTSHETRLWNLQDQEFWVPFNIGSSILDEYIVKPLDHYVMTKVVDDSPVNVTIRAHHLYGYFQKDGTLTKIYQPRNTERKFIKVTSYIQGKEQLQGLRHLLIPSSLKDIMAIKSLKLSIDMVAPDSENTMLPDWLMQTWIQDYEKVLLLFDNDPAGLVAMKKYKAMYPEVEPCILPMSKDPSDSIRDSGPREVRNRLVPILDKKLSKLVEFS